MKVTVEIDKGPTWPVTRLAAESAQFSRGLGTVDDGALIGEVLDFIMHATYREYLFTGPVAALLADMAVQTGDRVVFDDGGGVSFVSPPTDEEPEVTE